ncbi:MAG TPA: hypothetical protein VND64_06810 [Pirellulales bacterium]|nr:hypothetical protein [Pirellulales bacterium]
MVQSQYTGVSFGARARLLCVVCVIAWALAAPPPCVHAYPPTERATLDDVVAACRNNREKLATVLVEYELTGSALVDRRMLYEHLRTYDFPRATTITVVLGAQRRYCKVESDNKDLAAVITALRAEKPGFLVGVTGDLSRHVSFEDVDRMLPKIAATHYESVLVFDGTTVRERSPHSLKTMDEASPVYIVRDASTLRLRTVFPESYFDYIGYGASDPNDRIASKENLLHQLPGLLSIAPFAVAMASEDVAGSPCLVVEALGYQKLWLDAAIGFAMRKRQIYANAELRAEFEFDDFTEVLPGVWMPQTVTQYAIGTSRVPESYHGKRLIAYTIKVTALEANRDAHSTFFRLEPEVGSVVMDTTITPLDAAGNPVTSSVQIARAGQCCPGKRDAPSTAPRPS